MNTPKIINLKMFGRSLSAQALAVIMLIGTSVGVRADEEDAKRILKAMSEFMAAQESLSFEYDAVLEVITAESQILSLSSSGVHGQAARQDPCHAFQRVCGSREVPRRKDLTLLGKDTNLYAQLELPGRLDHLIDELHFTYNRPLPAADLMLPNFYDELMRDVVDVKDLGGGVIGGVECDYLAFQTDEVDWQIWIAQGDRPYPYRFSIRSKLIER